jgi:carbon monoxide dehydrogenase subunit G
MKFSGAVEIEAPRDRVWEFVSDPEKVASCGPGVESVEEVDDTHYKTVAKVGVGFISARFNGQLEIVERVEPERMVINVHGQAPGSAADAVASMSLRDAPDGGTIMDWSADVMIAGTLASVGARLIEGTANKLVSQTFDCIKARLEED